MAKVYQAPQTMYDGSTRTFEYFIRHDTVGVIAFLDPQTVLLTHQEQPGRSKPFYDPPGGLVEPDETPEAAAKREMEEETGYRAGKMELWWSDRYEGITRFEEFVFVAKDLEKIDGHNTEDAGERIKLIPTSWEDAVKMSLRREMRRGDIMLAILAMHHDPEARARLTAFLES